VSQANEEARKARHDKFYSIYSAKPTVGRIKDRLSKVRRYLSAYSPMSEASTAFVQPTSGMHTPQRFAKNMVMLTLAFFLMTSFDIGRAAIDAGEGWQVQFEGDALALNSDTNILADQEGYLMKAMPMSGEATYQGNRTEDVMYTVQSGDTMSGIAYRFGLDQTSIMAANDMTNANKLSTGDITIPPKDGAYIEVDDGDTLESLVENWGGDLEATKEFNEIGADNVIQEGDTIFIIGAEVAEKYIASIKPVYTASSSASSSSSYTYYDATDVGTSYLNVDVDTTYASADFVYPTVGTLTQGYYSGHYAYDVADRSQPAIVAVSDGIVTTASYGWNGGYGNYIIIDHQNGYKTLYAHNEEIYVSVGDYVTMGQTISKMGNSGRVYGVTGIHLHFEISYNGYKFPACDVGICY